MATRLKVATKWNELNDWQLSIIGRILYSDKALNKPIFYNVLIFILLLGKPTIPNFFKMLKVFRRFSFKEFSSLPEFIFDEAESLNKFPKSFTVKTGWFKKVKLYGPADRLANITVEELSYADAFYFNWITKSKDEDLRRLVACLYRPQGEGSNDVDPRAPFDKLLLPKNSELTDKIPMHLQYIIALAFQGTRRSFQSRYTWIYPAPTPKHEEVDEKPVPKKQKPYQPFSKIAQSMAMDDVQVFGTLQQTNKSNAIEFLEVYNELLHRQYKKK